MSIAPMTSSTPNLPGVCPVCGAFSLAPEGEMSALLAVCDVLVLKALEKLGNYLVRVERKRHNMLGGRPLYVAHTLWTPDDPLIDKALKNAWDVVPALLEVHGCCDTTPVQVTTMLDEYVHDLGVAGTAHTLEELQYRFTSRLDLPIYWKHALPSEVVVQDGHVEALWRDDPHEGLPREALVQDDRPTVLPVEAYVDYLPEEDPPQVTRVPDRIQGAKRENGFA